MQLERLTEVEQYNYCVDTLALKDKLELGYLEIAKRLYEIKTNKLYSYYGGWGLFLDEGKIQRSKADQLVRIYETFIQRYQIPEKKVVEAGGWSTVVTLLPMATSKELAEEALEQAKTLQSRAKTKDWVKEAITGNFTNCSHDNTYTLKVCRDCGERFKIDDSEQE